MKRIRQQALGALALGVACTLWTDKAAGEFLSITSPLSTFSGESQTKRVFRNEIQGHAYSDIDYPWRLLNRRFSLGSPARSDPTRALASTRLTLEDVSDSTSFGLTWRSEHYATTNPSIADEARWIVSGYEPYFHRLEGQIEILQWEGFGPKLTRRTKTQVGNISIDLAGALSIIQLDEMTIARGTGVVHRNSGVWTRLAADAELARSGRTFPFLGAGSSTGWAWSGDLAADVRSNLGTGLNIVLNDAVGEAHWARLPVTRYRINVANETLSDCCRADREPTVRFSNGFTTTKVPLPMKWRAEAYQQINQFRLGVGRSFAYDISTQHVSIGMQSGLRIWAIEHSLSTRSLSLSLRTSRAQIQAGFRPSEPDRSHALLLSVTVLTPY